MRTKQLLLSICIMSLIACGGSSKGSTSATTSSVLVKSSDASNSSNSGNHSSNSLLVSNSFASSSTSSRFSNATTKTLIAYGSNSMQVGELRLPSATSDKPFPLVIIVHGGCWVSSYADYHFMDTFAQAITDLGYATWNIEYRGVGTGGDWPVLFQDVSKAVDYSRTLAQSYPVDANKVAVIGHSAGGHIALWLASRNNLKSDSAIYTANPLPIRGVISLAGIANVTSNNSCYTIANTIIGVPITPSSVALTQRLQETSPLQMLPTHGKTILISGSVDGVVPAAMGTEYSTQATILGDDSLHYILQGLGHFELIDPTKTNWSLYQESLQEIFKQ